MAHVTIDLTAEQADALEQLIDDWTAGSADTPLSRQLASSVTAKTDERRAVPPATEPRV